MSVTAHGVLCSVGMLSWVSEEGVMKVEGCGPLSIRIPPEFQPIFLPTFPIPFPTTLTTT